jgi:hypothetical protein
VIVTLTVSATCDGAEALSDSDSTTLVVEPLIHEVTVTVQEPSPSAVLFGESTSLSATFFDTFGHGAASWSWDDGGAGGSFSPSAAMQSPTYTAPSSGGSELVVTLTAEATCDGAEPLSDSDSTTLYVSSVAHTLTVTAGTPDPATVESGGTSSLSATYSDSIGHGIALWQWSDGGAGGSFSPSANAQNPTYYAAVYAGGSELSVTLTVTGTCAGPVPISDSDLTTLTVEPAAGPRFMDVGTTLNLPSTTGVAWGDYNNDGYPDLYMGARWGEHRCVLFRNEGDGTFTDVTFAMGLRTDSGSWEDAGIAWGDYNNDGLVDLIVSGGNHDIFLYRNDGSTFTEVGGAAAGMPYYATSRGVAWGDYDGDNWLDVFIGYEQSNISRLYKNNRDGTFTMVNNEAGMEFTPAGLAAQCSWIDHNNDGLLDLSVARIQQATGAASQPRLYTNNGDGTFTDLALASGITGHSTMGLAWGDYDNDGFFDLVLGGNQNRPTYLYHNNGDGSFTDVRGDAMSGIGANTHGVAWADYDNDGFLDLAQGNGVSPPYNESGPSVAFLFHNDGNGTFAQVAPSEGVTAMRRYRGIAWADFNLDGRIDLLMGAGEGYSCLYENFGAIGGRNWLRVRALTCASGDASDGSPLRDALGARVDVNLDNDLTFVPGRTLARTIDGGSSWMSQNEQIAQFGLGAAEEVAVRVTFPDGTVVVRGSVAANQQIAISEIEEVVGWIEGVVTDRSDGSPIEGAVVDCGWGLTTTAVDGRYLLPFLPVGSYTLTASAEGYASESLPGVSVSAWSGTVADLELSPRTGSIEGIVSHALTGAPIAGATVACGARSTTTNTAGEYLLTDVPAGSGRTVTASADGYQSASQTEVTVIAETTITVDLSLVPLPGSIAGTVREAVSDTTGRYGSYLLPDVPVGDGYTVTASAAAYATASASGISVASQETTIVDFALNPKTGSVVGRVRDTVTEVPVTGATVECGAQSATTDLTGAYRIGSAPIGSRTVTASASGYESASSDITIVENETTVADLSIAPAAFGAVAGRVTSASTGYGIPGVQVTCGALSTASDSNGSYTLAGVPVGSGYRIGASAAGYYWASVGGVSVSTGATTTANLSLTPLASTSGAHFQDLTSAVSIPMAIGLGWGDYDGDGYPDLFVGGADPASSVPDQHGPLLYHNNGDRTFTEVSASVGLDSTPVEQDGIGWADYDNDGDLDVLVGSGAGYPMMYRWEGDGFTEVGAAAGFHVSFSAGRGVAWCDYDADGRLDAFCSNIFGPGYLMRNNGDGTFAEVSASSGLTPCDAGQSASWGDYNNDGWPDLVIARLRQATLLFSNNGDGTFTDVSDASGMSAFIDAYSAVWGDYDNDGWLDCYVTSANYIEPQTRRDALFHSNGDGTFTDVGDLAGMAGDVSVGLGAAWADYNNDGYLDLYVGNLEGGNQPFLYRNNGDGTFSDVAATAGVGGSRPNQAACWADIDLNGWIDLAVAVAGPQSSLFLNLGGGGNWLRVIALTDGDGDATDGGLTRAAVGARVELDVDNDGNFFPLRTLTRLIDGGSGFLGQNEQVAQFGVPANDPVAVRVLFPDGSVVTHRDVSLNMQIEIRDVGSDRVFESFPDVPLDSWAYGHIEGCVAAGVVAGYDDARYHGDWPVTRDQMAVYVARVLAGGDEGVPEFGGAPRFPDVPTGHWALKHVEYAAEAAVVSGYEDGYYHPEYQVDRGQMAVYMARAVAGGDGNVPTPSGPATFPDVPDTSWAYRHVEYCVSEGVVQGYDDGCYHPELVVTRDQMAVYVARAFELTG